MTGEMLFITEDGKDQDGEIWLLHAEIAKAIGGKLQPFDKYQGPYISIGPDLRVGNMPYAVPIRGLGLVRLWIVDDNEYPHLCGRIYREDTHTLSLRFDWWDTETAIRGAKDVLIYNAGNGGVISAG